MMPQTALATQQLPSDEESMFSIHAQALDQMLKMSECVLTVPAASMIFVAVPALMKMLKAR